MGAARLGPRRSHDFLLRDKSCGGLRVTGASAAASSRENHLCTGDHLLARDHLCAEDDLLAGYDERSGDHVFPRDDECSGHHVRSEGAPHAEVPQASSSHDDLCSRHDLLPGDDLCTGDHVCSVNRVRWVIEKAT